MKKNELRKIIGVQLLEYFSDINKKALDDQGRDSLGDMALIMSQYMFGTEGIRITLDYLFDKGLLSEEEVQQ